MLRLKTSYFYCILAFFCSIIIFIHIFNCNNIANVFKTWHISQWRGVDRIRGGKNNCVIMQTPSSLKNIDSAIKITSHKLHFPDLTRTTSRPILFCRYFSKFQPMPQCCGIWRRYKAEEPVSEWSPTAGNQRIWSGKNSFNFCQQVMIYDFDFVYWSNTSAVKKQEKSKKKIQPELVQF